MFKRLMKQIFSPGTGELLQNEHGHELPDATPIAPPIGYVKHPTIAEQIRDMVRSEQLRAAAMASGLETFEEADDFDIEDDPMPDAPYEANFDPPASSDFLRHGDQPPAPPSPPAPPPKPKKGNPSGVQPETVIEGSDPLDPQGD